MTRPIIICLHGLGASAKSFDKLLSTDLARDSNIVALDFAGFGERYNEVTSSNPLMTAAHEVEKEILGKNYRNVMLVGHSMGGAVAMLVLKNIPRSIAAVISIEGNLIAEDCGMISR